MGSVACTRQARFTLDWKGCPQHEKGARVGDDTIPIPVAGAIVNMPEYHDCQKFLLDGGKEFGPLAAIWAAQDLRRAFDRAGDNFIPVAEILISGRYNKLRVRPGFNCLYLQRRVSGADTMWTARMVHLGNNSAPCRDPVAPQAIGGAGLDVRPFPVPATLTAADIPPVARWDRTMHGKSNRGDYYVGLLCADRWCEIGAFPESPKHNPPVDNVTLKFTPVPSPTSPMSSAEMARVRDVQGWHDVQELAAIGGASSSGVTGAAFPQPELDRMGLAAFAEGQWIPSAYVFVDRRYAGAPLQLEQGYSLVELCRGTRCTGAIAACPNQTTPADPTGPWHARITWLPPQGSPQAGTSKGYCVRRHPHTMAGGGSGVIPAGAVRWAWNEKDESLWIRCAEGCCTID